MVDTGEQAERILDALRAEDGTLRRQGVKLLVGFVLDRRLDALVDPGETTAILVDALTEPNARRLLDGHLMPAWRRHRARAGAADERVGDAVPEEVANEVDVLLRGLRSPPAEWAREAIPPEPLRKLLSPVLQTTLVSFARKLPVLGLAGGEDSVLGGLAGRLRKTVERKAEQIADAGKGVMGGLGAEIEGKLQRTAAEFSQRAVGELRDALRVRLTSEEGQELVARIREHALARLLEAPVAQMMDDADALDHARFAELGPLLVAHNAERNLVRGAIAEEVAAYLAVEGARTLREMLDEAELLPAVTAMLERRVDSTMRDLLGTVEARAFLAKLLAL